MKSLRGVAVTAGAAALAAAALTGCGVEFNPGVERETRSYDIGGHYPAFAIRSDSGRVEVIGTDRKGIRVTEFLRWSSDRNKPKTQRTVRNGTLSLNTKCAANVIGYSACGASYRVELPRGTAVNLHSDSGRLTVRGMTGSSVRLTSDSGMLQASGIRTKDLRVESDSGRVSVSGQADTATFDAESGSIDASSLRARTVRARASSGRISLGLTSAPALTEAIAESGKVEITLPAVPQGYRMDLASEAGAHDVDPALRRNDGSPYAIRVRTDSGAVEISPTPAA